MSPGVLHLRTLRRLKFVMAENKHPQFTIKQVSPQTIAWITVSFSFVIFCVLCATGTFGAYWFFFESPIQMTTHLSISRGGITTISPADGTGFITTDSANNPKAISNNI